MPSTAGRRAPKIRKPLIIGLVAAAAVVVVVVGIVSVSGGGAGSKATAGETVTAYLEALSSGDAAGALSYGRAKPASTELLTDEILREQLTRTPISNIRILDENKSMDPMAPTRVHVAVNFGQTVSDATLTLTLDDDKAWKIDSAVVKIDPPFTTIRDLGAQTVTVFGKDFNNGPLYTFPGFQDLSSTNRYVKVVAEPLLLDRLQTLYTAASLFPQLTLNDDGHDAIQDQLRDAFANCQGSNLLAPPGCPAQILFSDGVDGTANWGTVDLSGVTIGDVSSFDMVTYVSGEVTIPVTYRTGTGDIKEDSAFAFVSSKADITKTPPELDLR